MKNTIQTMSESRGFQITTENGFTLSIGLGHGHYSDNYAQTSGGLESSYKPTATMEVAIMQGGEFVVLPYDVAAYVPVGNLAPLIEAVEGKDWERVLLLCDHTEEPDFSKFPETKA
jgi:hypothetical protein